MIGMMSAILLFAVILGGDSVMGDDQPNPLLEAMMGKETARLARQQAQRDQASRNAVDWDAYVNGVYGQNALLRELNARPALMGATERDIRNDRLPAGAPGMAVRPDGFFRGEIPARLWTPQDWDEYRAQVVRENARNRRP